MEEDNPYEKMLEEIGTLLRRMEANKSTPISDLNLPSDIEERLAKIEKDSKAFEVLSQKILELSQKEIPKSIRDLMPQTDELTPEGKRLINRGNELKMWAQSLQKSMIEHDSSQIQPSVGQEPAKTKKELEKGSGKKRKGKFRHMGGDSNTWKPI